jgi:hypothetical protein
MIELSTIRDLVTIFGVIAGITYYVMTVRNANRARKTQTLMQLRERTLSTEWLQEFLELLECKWTDYDDFLRKYDSSVSRDNYVKRYRLWSYLDGIGYLLHQDLIDRDSVYHLMSAVGVNLHWRKWKPIIEENRKRYDNPDWWMWFEYLADEVSKIRVERGHSPYTADVDGFFKT